jgi:acyl carrier protein
MSETQILGKLQQIFDNLFMDNVVVTRNLSAHAVPEWDSLNHVSLVLAVERAFQIQFRVGEVEATRNIGELVDLINRKCVPA